MNKNIDIQNIALVILGNFNPAIIHPSWLISKGLIRESDFDSKDIKVVHPEIANFSLRFAEIRVTKTKFEIRSLNEADSVLIRDLAVGLFSLLGETPIDAMGLNHYLHKTLERKEIVNFGDWLSPLSRWNSIMENPRLLQIQFTDYNKEENPKSTCTIMPSELLPTAFKFQLNYHFDNIQNGRLSDTISKNWEESESVAIKAFENLINLYNGKDSVKK